MSSRVVIVAVGHNIDITESAINQQFFITFLCELKFSMCINNMLQSINSVSQLGIGLNAQKWSYIQFIGGAMEAHWRERIQLQYISFKMKVEWFLITFFSLYHAVSSLFLISVESFVGTL